LTLSVRGRSNGKASGKSAKMVPVPGTPCSAASSHTPMSCRQASDAGASHVSASASVTSAARDRVRQVALEKHIEEVKAKANEALHSRDREQVFTKECENLEVSVANNRRAFYVGHQEQVKRQMGELNAKRHAGRQNAIAQASQHDFPYFGDSIGENPNVDVHDYMKERKNCLKEDLDQQVSQKKQERRSLKQKDMDSSVKDAEYSKVSDRRRMDDEKAKKELEKNILAEAWDRSIRLKQVQKAIDTHHMVGAEKELLPKFSTELRQKIPSLALASSQFQEQRLNTGSNASSAPARPPTGSARQKAPVLGAAASLALRRKQKGSVSARI